jgi:hypothetical protein
VKVTIENQEYEVISNVTPDRVVISYDDGFVFADRIDGTWQQSVENASPAEVELLKELLQGQMDKPVVTVTKDDQ